MEMETIFDYIVYQTVNTVNNKIYIGVHRTSSLEFDGYIGQDIYVNRPSSIKNPKTIFARAVKKYGFKAFKRTTLKTFKRLEDALDMERFLVDKEFVARPDTYNMVIGGGEILPTNAEKTFVYDKEGKFVKEFDSRTDAAKFIYGNTKSVSCITTAVKTGSLCNDMYQVSNKKVECMPNYINYKGTKWEKQVEDYLTGLKKRNDTLIPKKIVQKTLDGEIVKIWESLSACRKAGFTNVQRCVQNPGNKCKGFLFEYYKD